MTVVLALAIVAQGATRVASAAALDGGVIALSGQELPGLAPGVAASSFSIQDLNNAGEAVISASLVGVGIGSGNDMAAWRVGPTNAISLIGQRGDGQLSFAPDLGVIRLGDSGRILHHTSSGLWIRDGVGPEVPIALLGAPAPGMPAGAVFSTFSPQSFTSNLATITPTDWVAFSAIASGGGVTSANDSGVWRISDGGMLELVLRDGDPAATPVAGDLFADFSASLRLSFDDFGGAVLGPQVLPQQNTLWRLETGGTLEFRARGALAAPGFGAGVTMTPLRQSVVDPLGSGEIVSHAQLIGATFPTFADAVLYHYDAAGNPSVIWSCGDPLPGISDPNICLPGALGGFVGSDFSWERDGTLWLLTDLLVPGAPLGGVAREEDEAIFTLDATNQLALFVREGSLPGIPAGFTFEWDVLDRPQPNALGQVLLIGELNDGDEMTEDFDALVVVDPIGVGQVAVQRFDTIEVSPGVVRIIDEVQRARFNDLGDIVFQATCVGGGSGVFRISAPQASVPALGALPQLVLLLAVAALGSALTRKLRPTR